MKLFLSVPFSSRVDSQGAVHAEYRAHIEGLVVSLRAQGHEVFCALEDAGWVMSGVARPEVEFQKDLDEIDKADRLIVLLEERVSAGVQIETGYAFAKGKQMDVYQIGKPAWSNIAFSRVSGRGLIPVQSIDDFVDLVAKPN